MCLWNSYENELSLDQSDMKTVYVQVFHSFDSLDTDVYLLKYEINHYWLCLSIFPNT